MDPDNRAIVPNKADLTKRFLAFLIDALLVVGISVLPFIGPLIGTAYMLLRDGLDIDFCRFRSIGKKLMGLAPVSISGGKMDTIVSVKRNLPFVIGSFGSIFVMVPFFGPMLAVLFAVCGLVLVAVEAVLVITEPEGRRIGDKLADTKVIETDR